MAATTCAAALLPLSVAGLKFSRLGLLIVGVFARLAGVPFMVAGAGTTGSGLAGAGLAGAGLAGGVAFAFFARSSERVRTSKSSPGNKGAKKLFSPASFSRSLLALSRAAFAALCASVKGLGDFAGDGLAAGLGDFGVWGMVKGGGRGVDIIKAAIFLALFIIGRYHVVRRRIRVQLPAGPPPGAQ